MGSKHKTLEGCVRKLTFGKDVFAEPIVSELSMLIGNHAKTTYNFKERKMTMYSENEKDMQKVNNIIKIYCVNKCR